MAKRPPKPSPPDTADEARSRALRWLRLRDRSIEELRQRLSALDFSDRTIDETLSRLKAERLIDDARLAAHAVDRELSRRPAGDALFERRLSARGIKAGLIRRAIDGATQGQSELDRARALVAQLSRGERADARARRRIFGTLARRGFAEDVAMEAMDAVLGPEPLEREASPRDEEHPHEEAS